MHVYAPGATGYRVIGLTIADQPFIRVTPATYPASEIYHFEPLDERVPVYTQPFRRRMRSSSRGTRRRSGPSAVGST
jgi:hypothetical protein